MKEKVNPSECKATTFCDYQICEQQICGHDARWDKPLTPEECIDLDKMIDDAAKQYAKKIYPQGVSLLIDSVAGFFIDGAKSEAAHIYWKNKMKECFMKLYYKGRDDEYTEHEMNRKIHPEDAFNKWWQENKDK